MGFKFHDNNQHHENLDDWMKRNVFEKGNSFLDNHIKVTVIGKPEEKDKV